MRTLLESVAMLHAAGISHCSLHPDTIYIHSCAGTADEHGAVHCNHDCDFDGRLHRGLLGPNLFLQISNLEFCVDSTAMIGNDVSYLQGIHTRWHPYWSSPELCSLTLKPRSKLRKRNFRDSSGKTDVWSIGMLAMTLIERNIRLSPLYSGSKDSSNGTSAQTLREHSAKQVSRFTANPRISSLRKWTTLTQDFVLSCLRPNHADRPTAANAAKHPFLMTAQETVLLPLSDISESEASNLDDTYEDETTYIPAPDSDSAGGSSDASFWSDDETNSRASQFVPSRSTNLRSRGNSSSIEADMEISSEGSTGSVKIIKQNSEDEEEQFFQAPVSAGPNPKFSSTRRRGKSEHLPDTPVDPLDLRSVRIDNNSPPNPGRAGRVSPHDIHVRDGIQDGTGTKTNPLIAIHGGHQKPNLHHNFMGMGGSLPSNGGSPLSSSASAFVSFPSDTPDSAKESGGRKWTASGVTTPPPVRAIRARNAVVSSAPSSTTLERTPSSNSPVGTTTPKDFSPLQSPSNSSPSLPSKHIRPRERSPSPVRRAAPHPVVSDSLRRSSMPLLPITDLAHHPATTSASSTNLATPLSAGSAGSSDSISPSSASRLASHLTQSTPLLPPHHHLSIATPSSTNITLSTSPGSSPGGPETVSSYASSVSSHGSVLYDEVISKSSKDSVASVDARSNGGSKVAQPSSKATSLTDPLDRPILLNRTMRSRSDDVLFDKEQINADRKFSVSGAPSHDPISPTSTSAATSPPGMINWTVSSTMAPPTNLKMVKSPSGSSVPHLPSALHSSGGGSSFSTAATVSTTTPPSSNKTTPRKKVKRSKSSKGDDDDMITPPNVQELPITSLSSTGPYSTTYTTPLGVGAYSPDSAVERAVSPGADARKLPSLDEALAKEIKEVETKWQSEIRKRVKNHESREKEWVDKWSSKTRNVKKRYDGQVGALGKREETRMAEFKRMVTDDKTRLFQEHQREMERDEAPPSGRRNSVAAYSVVHKHFHAASEGGGGSNSSRGGSPLSILAGAPSTPSATPSSPQMSHHHHHHTPSSGLVSAREGKKTQFGRREVHLNQEKLIYEMDKKHLLERYDLELKLLDEADAIDRDYEVQKLFVKQQQLEALHDAQRTRLEEIFSLKTKMNEEIKSMMRKFVARKLKKLTDGEAPSNSRRGSSEFSPAQLSALMASGGGTSGQGGAYNFASPGQASPPNVLVLSGTGALAAHGERSPSASLPSPRFFGDLVTNSPVSGGNPLSTSGSAQPSYSATFGKISGFAALTAGDWWSQFSDLGLDALSPPTEYSLSPMEKFHRAEELSEWKQSEALAVLSRDLALAEAHKVESAELFERQAHELDVVRASFETHYVRSRQTFISERLLRASRYELEILDLKYAYLKRQVSKADEEIAMNEIRELEAQRDLDRASSFANFESRKAHLIQLGQVVSYSAFASQPPLAKNDLANLTNPSLSSPHSHPSTSSSEYHSSPAQSRAASTWTVPVITQTWSTPSAANMTPSSSAHSLPGSYSPSRSSLDNDR